MTSGDDDSQHLVNHNNGDDNESNSVFYKSNNIAN